MALGNTIMLPQDVADFVADDSEEFGGKLLLMGAQVLRSARFISLFSTFFWHLVIWLFPFILQLFQRVMATSAHLKKHATANQKVHGL